MEDVIRHVLILMAHLNVLVIRATFWQQITWTVKVNLLFSVINFILDVDECQISNGGCNQTCTNMFGSFECSCGIEYILIADNLGCESKSNIITSSLMIVEARNNIISYVY